MILRNAAIAGTKCLRPNIKKGAWDSAEVRPVIKQSEQPPFINRFVLKISQPGQQSAHSSAGGGENQEVDWQKVSQPLFANTL